MVKRGLAVAALCAVVALSWVRERERRRPAPAPGLESVSPAKITAGVPFNAQGSEESVIRVTGRNLFRGTRIVWNGEPLESSTQEEGTVLLGKVPARLYAQPGEIAVGAEQPGGVFSAPLLVRVLPRAGLPPELSHVYPETSAGAESFSAQPGGRLAMAVTGANYLPGAVIVLGGTDLETVYGDADRLSAFVPRALITRPRELEVRVRNPDGKLSASMRLPITATR